MTPPLERAARAMCTDRDPDDATGGCHPSGTFLDEGEPWWTGYTDQARAALLAIREPSEGMKKAGGNVEWWETIGDGETVEASMSADDVPRVWQAMIDAAISEGAGE